MKLKKNDNVMILAGKDRGKTGVILTSFPKEDKIVVKGIAMAKKHIKPSKKNPQGGIIDINLKIDASNALVVCPSCGKATKVGIDVVKGKRIRICKKCKQSIETNTNG